MTCEWWMFCLQNALVIDVMFLSNTYTIILHSRQSGPHTAKGAARAETGGGGHWWSADQSCPQTRGMMWAKCKICNKTRVRGMCCCCWSDRDWRTILNNIIHIETESTTEGLQARTSASRPIRFQQSSQQPNLIGLEAYVWACSPSVVLSVPMWQAIFYFLFI